MKLNLLEILEVVDKVKKENPYPEDIFQKPSEEFLKKLEGFVKSEGYTFDGVFGWWGRLVFHKALNEVKRAFMYKKLEEMENWFDEQLEKLGISEEYRLKYKHKFFVNDKTVGKLYMAYLNHQDVDNELIEDLERNAKKRILKKLKEHLWIRGEKGEK